jgi:hypothetical protein
MGIIVDPFETVANEYLPDFGLCIREFPDSGMIEMVMRRTNFMKELDRSRNQGVRGPVHPKTQEETEASKEENLRRAERRSRQKVRHLVMSIGADHLLTLTYRDLVTDSEKLASDYKEFVRLVRQKYPQWQYVAVKEFQDRGALHMHCAVVGKQDIEHLRKCWYQALGASPTATGEETPGAINVRYKKKRFSGQSPVFSALQLAAYLSKYISKTFAHERELGMHRYNSSRGIKAPLVMRQYLGAIGILDGEQAFPKAVREMLGIADLMGVFDYQIWATPDLAVTVLRGAMK